MMILLNRNRDTDVENKRVDTKWAAGVNWDTGIDVYTVLTLCIKQTTNENLLRSTGNPTQCSVVT